MMKRIFAIMLVMVAVAACAPSSQLKPRVAEQSLSMAQDGMVQVQPGDTVYSVSRRHKVPINALIRENNLPRPYILQPGTNIRLPAMTTYTVQPGDTMQSIATGRAVNPQELAELNSVQMEQLEPGNTLTVPAAVQSQPLASIDAPAGTTPPPTSLYGTPAVQQQNVMETGTTRYQLTPLGPVTSPEPVASPAGTVEQAAPPLEPGRFSWPVEGRVLKQFGTAADGKKSDGINIAAPLGTPITAAASGTVIHAGDGVGALGNLVLIRHEDGFVTAYGHLGRVLVDVDSIVAAGDVIGTIGTSGGLKVPQLHFQIRKGETLLNPQQYLPAL
jgi:murein DD-endopeptidase MepM/ murein hydrolase activator NlpD